jgi:hypothetical protein
MSAIYDQMLKRIYLTQYTKQVLQKMEPISDYTAERGKTDVQEFSEEFQRKSLRDFI